MKTYKAIGLTTEQSKIVSSIKVLATNFDSLINNYMTAIKNKTPFNLIEDEVFIALRQENLTIFKSILD